MAGNAKGAENTDIDKRHLLKSIQDLRETLEDGIEKNSETDVKTDVRGLLAETGGAAIKSYAAAFRSLQVTTKSSFEGLFQKFFHYPEVQESYDQLLELENAWDQSLVVCEESAGYDRSESGIPSVGSLGPISIQMVNARTEKATTLSDYLQESCNILLVLLRHFA